jgi:hypothetical protein
LNRFTFIYILAVSSYQCHIHRERGKDKPRKEAKSRKRDRSEENLGRRASDIREEDGTKVNSNNRNFGSNDNTRDIQRWEDRKLAIDEKRSNVLNDEKRWEDRNSDGTSYDANRGTKDVSANRNIRGSVRGRDGIRDRNNWHKNRDDSRDIIRSDNENSSRDHISSSSRNSENSNNCNDNKYAINSENSKCNNNNNNNNSSSINSSNRSERHDDNSHRQNSPPERWQPNTNPNPSPPERWQPISTGYKIQGEKSSRFNKKEIDDRKIEKPNSIDRKKESKRRVRKWKWR